MTSQRVRFNHVAKTESGKAGPQTIRTSLRKSFRLFGRRRNWVSAKDTENKGKIYEPRSLFQDTIMQAPITKDLPNSHWLVIIKYMSVIAGTIAIPAVIICNNQTFVSKKCAAIMRIRFALSSLKRAKKCSFHKKRFLKNIVSFTPIHKDEHITKKNSEEIISMFRWIAVLTVKRIQYQVLRKTIRVFHEFEEESKENPPFSGWQAYELCLCWWRFRFGQFKTIWLHHYFFSENTRFPIKLNASFPVFVSWFFWICALAKKNFYRFGYTPW